MIASVLFLTSGIGMAFNFMLGPALSVSAYSSSLTALRFSFVLKMRIRFETSRIRRDKDEEPGDSSKRKET